MKAAALPADEQARLEALKAYDVLDTPPEQIYDDITKIASEICRTPIALISLIDANKQWNKSKLGINTDEAPREYSFCAHAILEPNEPFVVPDARRDERFATNPATTDAPHVVFYAGIPLTDSDGYALGSLCVIDSRIRTLTDNQLLSLKSLARLVMAHFELRKVKAERDRYQHSLRQASAARRKLLRLLMYQAEPLVEPMLGDIQALAEGNPRPDQLVHVQSLQAAGRTIKSLLDDPDVFQS